MFTGIIETLGQVVAIVSEDTSSNIQLVIESAISSSLTIDQSVAHNGICLTVEKVTNNTHTVTAINETLQKTTLETLVIGDFINLELCLKIGDRLDGHMVQGHVDTTAQLLSCKDENGSYLLQFSNQQNFKNLIVEKGSICLNGISLTLVDVELETFKVAVIPYTWQNTNLKYLKIGQFVNIEFDIIAKYINRIVSKAHL